MQLQEAFHLGWGLAEGLPKANFLPLIPTQKPPGRTEWGPAWGLRGELRRGRGVGGAAPSLRAGPRRHHYQAVLETRHHPMLPSKMAMAAPKWVWGPPGLDVGQTHALRTLR